MQQNTAETRVSTKLAAMKIAIIKKQLCRIIEETAYYMSTVRLKCPTWSMCPGDMKLEAPWMLPNPSLAGKYLWCFSSSSVNTG